MSLQGSLYLFSFLHSDKSLVNLLSSLWSFISSFNEYKLHSMTYKHCSLQQCFHVKTLLSSPWIRTTLYPIHVIHLLSKIGCPWPDPGTAISRQLILNTQVIMSILFRLVTSDFALNSWRSEKCRQNLIFIHYYFLMLFFLKRLIYLR